MKCIQVKADGTTCGRESERAVCPECWRQQLWPEAGKAKDSAWVTRDEFIRQIRSLEHIHCEQIAQLARRVRDLEIAEQHRIGFRSSAEEAATFGAAMRGWKAAPALCRYKSKRVYQGLSNYWIPLDCTNEATVRGLCPYHAAQKCDGCGGQAVRACPADGCFKALCDNCTHIVSGVHAPPAKGWEPVRCNYGVDDPKPRLRHCFKTAIEASVYCEDHQPPAPLATASRRIQDLETLLASERAALAEARKRIEAMNAKQAEPLVRVAGLRPYVDWLAIEALLFEGRR